MYGQDVKDCFVSTYKKLLGHIGQTCEVVGIGRKTYYEWRADDKNFRQALEDVEESFLDTAEEVLRRHIEDDDLQAAKFLLQTIGKRRGYTTQTDVQQLNAVQPTIHIVLNQPEGQKVIDLPAVEVLKELPPDPTE